MSKTLRAISGMSRIAKVISSENIKKTIQWGILFVLGITVQRHLQER